MENLPNGHPYSNQEFYHKGYMQHMAGGYQPPPPAPNQEFMMYNRPYPPNMMMPQKLNETVIRENQGMVPTDCTNSVQMQDNKVMNGYHQNYPQHY